MENIKDRIRALMAKTTENGCTEEEALAASNKVQELLFKYQLSLSDIKLKEESNCRTGGYDANMRKGPNCKPLEIIVSAVSYLTDTKCWSSQTGGADGRLAYKFFGFDSDVLIAEYITKLCDWAIIYGGEDFKSHPSYNSLPTGPGRAKILLDFRIAMAYRLNTRLRGMKDTQKQQSDGRSLIITKSSIVTDEFAKLNLRLGKAKQGKSRNYDSAAWSAGTAAADKVQINPGVRGNETKGVIANG